MGQLMAVTNLIINPNVLLDRLQLFLIQDDIEHVDCVALYLQFVEDLGRKNAFVRRSYHNVCHTGLLGMLHFGTPPLAYSSLRACL